METKKVAKIGLASAAAAVATGSVANADPFEGFFFGISGNTNSGKFPWADGLSYNNYILNPIGTPGVFGGFNAKIGSNGLVVGGEIAMQGEIDGSDPNRGDEYRFNNLVDAKFRLGTATQVAGKDVLVYGFGGISGGNIWVEDYNEGYGSSFGTNIGLGADVMLSNDVSVGLEWIHRSMWGYDEEEEVGTQRNQTVSLRAAFHY